MGCAVLLTVLCLLVSPSARADNRRAVLVMDVDSGDILRQENAHARRYPASLTKMMTLYLLFDALRKGEVKLGSRFTASAYAASQPQTNISLRPGDKLSVEDAIKALVVRSANDVAVVVAEGLGRSEWNFGVMMTQKARELGMKDTVFRNPNGLPNPRQYTTAYDMALLGAALRRDFPQYYGYFTTNIFRYKGRTYTGHNRVIGRFGGVDGIKTGFINASGFNLVTSVKRDGYYVVAVVMGGTSGASRDNEMVSILERTFAALGSRRDRPRSVASAPVSVSNPKRAAVELAAASGTPMASIRLRPVEPEAEAEASAPSFSFRFGSASGDREHMSAARKAESEPAAVVSLSSSSPVAVTPEPKKLPPKGTLEYQMAMIESGQGDVSYDDARDTVRALEKSWGIQVGAFRREDQARDAVKKVFGLLRGQTADVYIAISGEGDAAHPVHRARLGNFSKAQAEAACRTLTAARQSCFPVQME